MDTPVKNYCPFGCQMHQLEELGYCPHLVGFTNDGKTFERLVRIMNFDGEFVRFSVRGKKVEQIQGGDLQINPEFDQLDNGIVHKAKTWVSARVYRKVPERTEVGPKPNRPAVKPEPTDEQLDELTRPVGAA